MTDRRDIIRSVIDCVIRQVSVGITAEQALAAEREARREWGGHVVGYVAKTCAADLERRRQLQGRARPDTEQAVRADYLANKPLSSITSDRGISRATLYRIIKR
jgi:transposase-like protein